MITINGAQGEGGGQVLRTSLALAMVTGQAVRIENIRANRSKPGLLRQHLTSVEAACAVSYGEVDGAELGSPVIEFTPNSIRGGAYTFAIGTAGSTTLVLQTVLPALMLASEPSSLAITGGTHNPHAPTVRFLTRAFLPILERMGPRVRVHLDRHGFYPAGGGQIRIEIEPAAKLSPIELCDAGTIESRSATATIAGLPGSIAKRELDVVSKMLDWDESTLRTEQVDNVRGSGNVLSIEVVRENVTEVFTGFGERGVSAERVASDAAKQYRRYIAVDVPVGEYLADQLMLPFALAGNGAFVTGELSEHARSNASVIESFGCHRIHLSDEGGNKARVSAHSPVSS